MSNELENLIGRLRMLEGERKGSEVERFRKRQAEEVEKKGYFVMRFMEERLASERIVVFLHPLPWNNNPKRLLHTHSFFELMYVYRGTCHNQFRETELMLAEGDILLLNPLKPHCPVTETEQDCLFNIVISIDYLKSAANVLLHDNPLFSAFFMEGIFRSSGGKEYLHFHSNEETRQAIERLIMEYYGRKPCFHAVVQSLLTEVFAYLSRMQPESGKLLQNSNETLARNIYSYIQDHSGDVSLQILSNRYHLSESYLSRVIKQNLGRNFSDLVQEAKINRARFYLENSTMPILDIAFMCGYSDLSYFYKVFRQYYGTAPVAYRKKCCQKSETPEG